MERNRTEGSPRALSRVGGLLYLVIIVGGLVGEGLIRSQLIASGDAATTAANIRAAETLWRFGVAAEYLMLACSTVLALILFVLLRHIHRALAWLAVFFNLIAIAVEAGNEMQLLRALIPLGQADYLGTFEPAQLYAMTRMALETYGYGFGASLIFFGCECLALGYLIYRSCTFPRAVGVLMVAAGVSYLVNSFALIVSPAFAAWLYPTILLPAFVGELSLCLWLLVQGVPMPEAALGARVEPAASAYS